MREPDVETTSTPRILKVLVLVLLACIWAMFARLLFTVLTSDISDLGGAEAFVIYTLVAARDGQSFYPDVMTPPFVITQYSPLYYFVCDQINAALGLDASRFEEIASVARSVTIASWLLVSGLVFWFWKRHGFGTLASLAAATSVFVGNGQFPYQARPDALEVLCSTISILLLWHACGQARFARTSIVLAGLFGCLAAFTKQNGAVTLLYAVVAGLYFPKLRILRYFVCGFAAAAMLTFVPVSLHFGMPLKNHLIDGVSNGIDLQWSALKAYFPFMLHALPFIAGGVGISLLRLFDKSDARLSMLAAITLCSLVAHAIAALKYGSAENYFMEFTVLAVLVLGAELAHANHSGRRTWFSVGFVAFVAMAFSYGIDFGVTQLKAQRYSDTGLKPLVDELGRRLEQNPGTFFVSTDTRLPVIFPRRTAIGQILVVSNLFQRRVFSYAEYFKLVQAGVIRYHVVDLRRSTIENIYNDSTNLEYPLYGFRSVGIFGAYALLENPRAGP